MDGLQTRYQAFPGQEYKGSRFEGRLKNDSEGVTVCGMLKTAFKRGQMFTIGEDWSVGLDGISMFDSPLLAKVSPSRCYVKYIQKVKAELAAKGITEANIDQTEKLEETFSVAGP
ncbi:E3 ubiquitin-protein ligase DTX3L-like [Mya arenaria]|uniref:E3 ubiquitin-protein ligase DTX3L-like n=1 Tax=Mya arenaria TaxID=6604 RepID=UPI0022E08D2C|nr:E3 ubiquitin-protein ligase DTX3L-like [Mya arenaria]